jgi:hypothetical protein
MKLKRAGEDFKPTEEIPIKGVETDIVDSKPCANLLLLVISFNIFYVIYYYIHSTVI